MYSIISIQTPKVNCESENLQACRTVTELVLAATRTTTQSVSKYLLSFSKNVPTIGTKTPNFGRNIPFQYKSWNVQESGLCRRAEHFWSPFLRGYLAISLMLQKKSLYISQALSYFYEINFEIWGVLKISAIWLKYFTFEGCILCFLREKKSLHIFILCIVVSALKS